MTTPRAWATATEYHQHYHSVHHLVPNTLSEAFTLAPLQVAVTTQSPRAAGTPAALNAQTAAAVLSNIKTLELFQVLPQPFMTNATIAGKLVHRSLRGRREYDTNWQLQMPPGVLYSGCQLG
jgi:hypothetical protein